MPSQELSSFSRNTKAHWDSGSENVILVVIVDT